MEANDEAVANFLNGKRNLAAYQFSELMRIFIELNKISLKPSHIRDGSADEIAFNYALVNLFTGCPQRASIIFNDLATRYPKNPRLWLRLAESLLATERAKLDKFEHVQSSSSNDMCQMLLKTKNTPIFIKVNPNYHQQFAKQQQRVTASLAPKNFLSIVLTFLKKASNLINEYDLNLLLTDDVSPHNSTLGLSLKPSKPTTSSTFDETKTTSLRESASNVSLNSQVDDSTIQDKLSQPNKSDSSEQKEKETLSERLLFTNPSKCITRSDLYDLKIKVQLDIAYVCLCMSDPTQALDFTTKCLNSNPSGYEKVLANLYHAEACILLGRVDEAIQFLNVEVLNGANSLYEKHPVIAGVKESPIRNIVPQARKVVYSDELKHQLESKALSTVLKYNLCVAYAAKGDINKAEELLSKTDNTSKPTPMHILICVLYIQLQQGQLEKAKKTILCNLPQFR